MPARLHASTRTTKTRSSNSTKTRITKTRSMKSTKTRSTKEHQSERLEPLKATWALPYFSPMDKMQRVTQATIRQRKSQVEGPGFPASTKPEQDERMLLKSADSQTEPAEG